VSSSLPKTSYFKMVDVWLLFCIGMIFIIIIFHAIIDRAFPETDQLMGETENPPIVFTRVTPKLLEQSKPQFRRNRIQKLILGSKIWNARCVEEDSGMRYLVGLDEECNMTVVNAKKDFLVHAWNK
ncbi:Neurotransmitter-gated ion-channel transmembrane domain, partial [Trinorchestia longiramus]